MQNYDNVFWQLECDFSFLLIKFFLLSECLQEFLDVPCCIINVDAETTITLLTAFGNIVALLRHVRNVLQVPV